jgi:hypothetical protein
VIEAYLGSRWLKRQQQLEAIEDERRALQAAPPPGPA